MGNSYEGQLKCRIESVITRYHNQLKAIASRRHCFVVSIFHKLYAGTGHANTSTAKMVEYKKKLDKEVEKLVKEFRKKVEAVVAQLKDSYRCNYKCYFQIGCRGFSRRSYSRSCVRFTSPPCYSYKLTGLCLSTLTGTVVLTTASEPAQQNRRFAFLTTKNTSKKSMLRRFSTKLISTKRLLNG